MDKKEERALLPEEQEVIRIIQETDEKITWLDKEIENVLPSKGYTPKYTLPGAPDLEDKRTPQQKKDAIELRKQGLKSEARQQMNQVMQNKPLDVQLLLFDRIDRWENRNPIQEQEPKEGEKILGETNLDTPQDGAMRMLGAAKKTRYEREGASVENMAMNQAANQPVRDVPVSHSDVEEYYSFLKYQPGINTPGDDFQPTVPPSPLPSHEKDIDRDE